MAEVLNETKVLTELNLFGRRKIYTTVTDVTRENVIEEVNRALSYHMMNVAEMNYLYWYRRGLQPILFSPFSYTVFL